VDAPNFFGGGGKRKGKAEESGTHIWTWREKMSSGRLAKTGKPEGRSTKQPGVAFLENGFFWGLPRWERKSSITCITRWMEHLIWDRIWLAKLRLSRLQHEVGNPRWPLSAGDRLNSRAGF